MQQIKRIQQELSRIKKQNLENIIVQETDNPFIWNVEIEGPKDSYYEGGKFNLQVIFPVNYPYKMPEYQFKTLIWHPNIIITKDFPQGFVCKRCVLSEDTWLPTKMAFYCLEIILNLLFYPEFVCFCNYSNQEAIDQYKRDKNEFKETVQKYIQSFAKQ